MLGMSDGYGYDADGDHVQNVNAQGSGGGAEEASEISLPPPYSTAVRAEQRQ